MKKAIILFLLPVNISFALIDNRIGIKSILFFSAAPELTVVDNNTLSKSYPVISKDYPVSAMFDGKKETYFMVLNSWGSWDFEIIFNRPLRIDKVRLFTFPSKMTKNTSFFIGITIGTINEFGTLKILSGGGGEYNEANYNGELEFKIKEIYTNITFFSFEYWGSLNFGIREIELWNGDVKYIISNLVEIDKAINYDGAFSGHIWKKRYWIGEPIQYKEQPRKKWWEFWKKGDHYLVEESRILRMMTLIWKKFTWAIDKIWMYVLVQLACFLFAIREKKEGLPRWTKVLSVVAPLLLFLLVGYKVIAELWEIDSLTVIPPALFITVVQLIVGIVLLGKGIKAKKGEITFFSKIGYIIYGITLPLSMIFILLAL